MKFTNEFEKKFGKYAVKNLSLVLIICYACGYLFEFLYPSMLGYLFLNPYKIIFEGQVWRLFTWVLVPPSSFNFFTLLMLYFYYSLGTTLERTWGTYRYNVYIFSGILFTVLGAFLLFGYGLLKGEVIQGNMMAFSTYYVNMSIFLAFAATYPNMQILLFFLLPIRIKIMGIIYGALLVYEFFMSSVPGKFVIAASLMNFIVFFLTGRGRVHMTPGQARRRQKFRKEVKKTARITRHKCAVCGRTEETNPELEFRFCSKCDGNYEYCQEHLFTHTHVKMK